MTRRTPPQAPRRPQRTAPPRSARACGLLRSPGRSSPSGKCVAGPWRRCAAASCGGGGRAAKPPAGAEVGGCGPQRRCSRPACGREAPGATPPLRGAREEPGDGRLATGDDGLRRRSTTEDGRRQTDRPTDGRDGIRKTRDGVDGRRRTRDQGDDGLDTGEVDDDERWTMSNAGQHVSRHDDARRNRPTHDDKTFVARVLRRTGVPPAPPRPLHVACGLGRSVSTVIRQN